MKAVPSLPGAGCLPNALGSRQTPIDLYPAFQHEPPDAGLESSQAEKHHGTYRLGIPVCRSIETAPNEVSALAGGDPGGLETSMS